MSTYFALADYWDWLFEQADYKLIFAKELSDKQKKELFAKYVRNINIETSAFCNRKCSYCPLSVIDRKQELMSEKNWQWIIRQLEDIKYSGRITFALFNEPLLDKSICNKVLEVSKKLPDVLTAMYSNGDYFSKERCDSLEKSGLRWLLITRHFTGDSFNQKQCKKEVFDYIEEIGMSEYIVEYNERNKNNVSYVLKYGKLDLYIVVNNWAEDGCDRGGFIEELKSDDVRVNPCAKAIRDFNISFDGNIKPCCNIYFGENTNYGSVLEDGILDCYFKNLREFRIDKFKFGEKLDACRYCKDFDNASRETMKLRNEIKV